MDPDAALQAVVSSQSLGTARPGQRVTVSTQGDLSLTLFDGDIVPIEVSEVALTLDAEGGDGTPNVEVIGRHVVAGTVQATASFTFVRNGAGHFDVRGGIDRGQEPRIQLASQRPGVVSITEVGEAQGRDGGQDAVMPPGSATADATAPAPAVAGVTPTVDVLVGYVATIGSQAPAAIAQSVAETNAAFVTSHAEIRLNLVSTIPIQYTQEPDMLNDMSNLTQGMGGLELLKAQRDAIGADLVALIVPSSTVSTCGLGYLPTAHGLPNYATSVTAFSCLSNYTFSHEIGHNLGGNHDPANSHHEDIPFAFSYGHQVPGKARTIMAYACPKADCPRKLQYSNPSVPFIGYPTIPSGTATADNARSISLMAPVISAYRSSTPAIRLAGADRFETSAAISRHGFPDPSTVDTVLVATGVAFPDALSGAPLAAKLGGPLLLTTSGVLSPPAVTEISRLKPSRIIILGGTDVVGTGVESTLKTLIPASGSVVRLAGGDRWDTSLKIASYGWKTTGAAFVATGLDYPDALSAGAAGGVLDAPVILVNGGGAAMPTEALTYLANAGVKTAHIAGGTFSVSAAIENDLKAKRFGVVRYAGSDRFNTSTLIGRAFHTKGGSMYLAAGTNFPDALGGAAVAGGKKAPLLLSASGCVLKNIQELRTEVDPSLLVLLGGANLLSEAVRQSQVCS